MLQRPEYRDEGLTLIEVMIALLVFAILCTGIIAGSTTIVRMTGDNRSRATAMNLAAQDIDLIRALADPFKVVAATSTVGVDGRTYTVTRRVSWISSAGTDISCNSASNLFYLRVNVRVTWPGMLGTTAAVQDDTILAPVGRISDTGSGSIAVSVAGVDAKPQAGVSVTITPASGGTGKPLTTPPKATVADGCTYANQVAPGAYTVTINKSGWIDDQQVGTPTKTVVVTAGSTQSAVFQYDQAATYSTTYTSGPRQYTATSSNLPTGIQTNFISTSGTYTTTVPAASVKLHPYASGYSVVMGKATSGTTTCASLDPAAWSAAGTLATGVRASAAAVPGGTAALSIPMGVVLVTAPANQVLGIVSATPQGAGNPGCGITGTSYTYSVRATGAPLALAVPYGSWKVLTGSSSPTTPVAASQLQIVTNTNVGGVAADGTVTLDPRAAK